MSVGTTTIGGLSVSRLIVGGNPFSGISHQSAERDAEMMRYYTTARIKETLGHAEALGIDTFIGRADNHIVRVLLEYREEGGSIQWLAQSCPEFADPGRSISNAVRGGARGCYLHGGQMDHLFAAGELDSVPDFVNRVREAGLVPGIAAHNPRVLEWADENLDVDFYMCSYYNPSSRERRPDHDPSAGERFDPDHRGEMVRVIGELGRPAIHYKVLAAGRSEPREALAFVARHLRPQDAVCVGVYTGDDPDMLEKDLLLLEEGLAREEGPDPAE